MAVSPNAPTPGALVRVRSRQYLVESVDEPVQPHDSPLVRLSCLEDDAQGEPLEVLWDYEVDARVLGASSWEAVARRGFDQPSLFSAYLHTLRWSCVTATNARLFQAPFRAGIQVKAYQLEPLRKALQMPRINLFIADDVGVGKTIEAGLILRETILRQKVRRVIISCPPSVVRQWRDEMEQRFGISFVVLDREYVIRCGQERGYGINPWSTHSRFILSHALLRDESYAGPLRNWLGDFAPGSLLILDEAHNAAPASGTRYAVDSHLTTVLRDLAPRFEHRLFLSATPHNGHSNSFSALLEILDPQRFCRGVPVSPQLRDEVMVRRLKSDIRALDDERDFPERRVVPLVLKGLPDDTPELRLALLLQEYRSLREARLRSASASRKSMALLVLINLQKRLLSSVEAFASTLKVHRDALERARMKARDARAPARTQVSLTQSLLLEAPGADDARAEFSDQELATEEAADLTDMTLQAELEQGDETLTGSEITPRELALLDEMLQLAQLNRYKPDARVRALLHWIRTGNTGNPSSLPPSPDAVPLCPALGTPGARWSSRRVILFTEYTDTRRYLEQQLESALTTSDQGDLRIANLRGNMPEREREEVIDAFNGSPDDFPVRILIATDAAREGLNLQNHCADLFHFDIPWNPSRMEQRNGRIDRKLQKAKVVNCHYFVYAQRPEDRVLETLVRKTATIHRELGSLSPSIERKLNQVLTRGIAHPDAGRLASSIEEIERDDTTGEPLLRIGTRVIQEELESTRKRHKDLTLQLEELRGMLTRAREWINFREDHFRDALSASLKLLGAQPLAREEGPDGVVRWMLPDLELKFSGDPAWSRTLDGLRPPRKPEQKYWDWRRDNPIRPIVFQDTGEVGGRDVHLHLEHRLTQRLLNRFLAQGFLYDELTRAVVCLTDFPEPRVLALGRISLYGLQAARLHDELVAVAAAWTPLELRGRKKLEVLGEGKKDEVLGLLETSLATPRLQNAPEGRKRELQEASARDVEELLPALERRAKVLEERARRDLQARGEAEALAMVNILQEQRIRIRSRIRELESPAQKDPGQLSLFPVEEEKQLEADRRYWPRRLKAIDEELVREPARIRASYEVKAVRVEPVGLVYLWPVTG